ncbi:MAG: DNA-processing protein DprA, partial [Candidatus Geothermincolia bacterium]
LARSSPDYPRRLEAICDPPELLFCSGGIEHLSALCIGVVGSRRASSYGAASARSFGRELAAAGVIVTSGAAYGIDAAAHGGALEAAAPTVAVLGCGIDRAYPPRHLALLRAIARTGCVVSEYAPGTPPLRYHFPERNRVIAGLAAGLVVVEAGEGSGALITVDLALAEGRDVFAVPGRIGESLAAGPHRLIQAGAKLVTCAADVLDEYPGEATQPTARSFSSSLGERSGFGSPCGDEAAGRLLAMLKTGPRQLDALIEESGLARGVLFETLTELQLNGLIHEEDGRRFALTPGGREAERLPRTISNGRGEDRRSQGLR